MQDDIRAPLSELTAHAQDFFRQFPTPLALIGPDGRAETNARFGQLFDRACLQSEALLAVVRNPGRPWQALQAFMACICWVHRNWRRLSQWLRPLP